ncbi:aspartate racemase/maleate isomerase family protein [Streptomyces zagrosensis]|uniref:Maleate isomerase n=1 Tax=Streptomyces zagrosensis TaxID=1042984 RepID=A0A7W9V376_9ACTN|nr:hypothetical protein [Streptomyces zagrosensis]MBB5940006.1 maleate isomerase [Streptomyces zagrosensis]
MAALDAASARTVRAGLLLPWANVAVETELARLGLRRTVFHHARLVPASRTTAIDASFWHGLRAASAQALDSLSHVPLDVVMLACTSAGFSDGPPLPDGVFTAFDALLQALTRAAAARVVLVTPYPVPVTEAEAAALAAAGVEVLAHASLGLADGYPAITPEQILSLTGQLPQEAVGAAEAVVFSCTGWHTLAVIPELEHRFGKPVLSSNLAMALLAARARTGVCS